MTDNAETLVYVVECDRAFVNEPKVEESGEIKKKGSDKKRSRGSKGSFKNEKKPIEKIGENTFLEILDNEESSESEEDTVSKTVCYQFKIGDTINTGDVIEGIWLCQRSRQKPFPSLRGQNRMTKDDETKSSSSHVEHVMNSFSKGLGWRDAIRVMMCFMGTPDGDSSSRDDSSKKGSGLDKSKEAVKSILLDWSDFSNVPSKPEVFRGSKTMSPEEMREAEAARAVSNELAILDRDGKRILLPVKGVIDSDMSIFVQVSAELDRIARMYVVCKTAMLSRSLSNKLVSEPSRWTLMPLEERLSGRHKELSDLSLNADGSPPTSSGCCSILTRSKGSKTENIEKREKNLIQKRQRKEPPGTKVLIWDPTAEPGNTLRVTSN